ncbi:MAG TPA: DUF167 domain-containing protein [Methylomirabilota bacterium]|jgi:uncharacterized protein (TIGR00251 family)
MPAKATAARPEAPLLHVRVQPRARRSEVVGWQDSVLRVRVTAAPYDGEANHAVARLLAKALDVAPSRVALVRGATTRDKLFRIERLSLAEVRARIPQGGAGDRS